MEYTIQQLSTDVLGRLGEQPVAELPADLPTVAEALERKLRAALPEVGARLICEAPAEKLGGGGEYGGLSVLQIEARRLPCGLYGFDVEVPADFVRLVVMRMESWDRDVHEVAMPGEEQHLRQYSPEAGIAGCGSRPRVYLNFGRSGMVLTAIGSDDDADRLAVLGLWRMPIADGAGKFQFPAPLYPALVSAMLLSRTRCASKA